MIRPITFFFATTLVAACAASPAPGPQASDPHTIEIFDGATLSGWRPAELGGGSIDIRDGRIVLAQGTPLTGIALDDPTREIPREDYELVVSAARLAGSDFFLALTFPVGDVFATVVLGGWGGSLCGLSCVDGKDASQNPTRTFRGFAAGAEVTLRVAVTREAIAAWVDGEPLFVQPRAGHTFGLRPEMAACRPLGIAAYQTRSAVSRVSLVLPRGALELAR